MRALTAWTSTAGSLWSTPCGRWMRGPLPTFSSNRCLDSTRVRAACLIATRGWTTAAGRAAAARSTPPARVAPTVTVKPTEQEAADRLFVEPDQPGAQRDGRRMEPLSLSYPMAHPSTQDAPAPRLLPHPFLSPADPDAGRGRSLWPRARWHPTAASPQCREAAVLVVSRASQQSADWPRAQLRCVTAGQGTPGG